MSGFLSTENKDEIRCTGKCCLSNAFLIVQLIFVTEEMWNCIIWIIITIGAFIFLKSSFSTNTGVLEPRVSCRQTDCTVEKITGRISTCQYGDLG